MKKNIKTLAALLIASATFVACSSDNDIIGENQQPVNPTGKYTMTIQASKGDGATTRALNLTDHTLNATWSEGEIVEVYQGGSKIGELTAAASTDASTTLTGTFDAAPSTSADLTFYFHTNTTSYSGQDGTLATIASSYDFCAPATVATGDFTVNSANHTISVPAGISFGANQQAIIKFTLKDKGNSDAAISPSALTVTDGTSTVELTSIPDDTYSTNGAGVLYVAFPAAGSDKTITLTATVGDDSYTYTTSSAKTFVNGQYYEITVKMSAPAPSYTMAAAATTSDKGKLICTAGHIHVYGADATCTAGRVAKIIYVGPTGHATYNHGLALALEDMSTDPYTAFTWDNSGKNNGGKTAAELCSAWNTSKPVMDADWLLASKDQWDYMLGTNGAGSYYALRVGFESVGGSNLVEMDYWSSTEYEYNTTKAWSVNLGYEQWYENDKDRVYPMVRACLAF